MLVTSIFSFPTMFSILYRTNFAIWITFNSWSANAFNLYWSKILSFGKGLISCNVLQHVLHSGMDLVEVGNDEIILRLGKQANKRHLQFALQSLVAVFGKYWD